MSTVTIDLPGEVLRLLGSEEDAQRGAKVAVVLDLVRRGKVSHPKAAEILAISLQDLPALLAQYNIPWFDYSEADLDKDLDALRPAKGTAR